MWKKTELLPDSLKYISETADATNIFLLPIATEKELHSTNSCVTLFVRTSRFFLFFSSFRNHRAEAMTMTSDLCVGEGREQKDLSAEINKETYHYNKALVRFML